MRTVILVVGVLLGSAGCSGGTSYYKCGATVDCAGNAHDIVDTVCATGESDARGQMQALHPTTGICAISVNACTDQGEACN